MPDVQTEQTAVALQLSIAVATVILALIIIATL